MVALWNRNCWFGLPVILFLLSFMEMDDATESTGDSIFEQSKKGDDKKEDNEFGCSI